MPFSGSKDKKVLVNPGATDPKNSVFQVLYRTRETREALEKCLLPTSRLSLSYWCRVWSRTERSLRDVFGDLQKDCEQHDAAEHMEQVLSSEELSAEVCQPFRGTLVCSEGHCIEEMSQFWTLPLPFRATVEEGVQLLFQCSRVCSKHTEAAAKDKTKTPPQLLVFHLKRFDLTQKKNDSEVELTETLQTQGLLYSLWGVVDHWGSVRTGSYSATLCCEENGLWYQFSENPLETEVEAPSGKKSSTAVLIIYRKNEQGGSCRTDPHQRSPMESKNPTYTTDLHQRSPMESKNPTDTTDLHQRSPMESSEFYTTDQYHQRQMESTGESYQRRQMESSPYHGLINQGATCYLNSVLQLLFMTPEFKKSLERPSNQTDHILRSLFDDLQRETCGTWSLTAHLQAPNVQRCAAEYLEILLNRVSQNVSEPFCGEFLDITRCSKNHVINEEPSKFWTLPLSMQHVCSSVSEGFEGFFKENQLSGIHCKTCRKSTEAISKYEMTKPPQILVLLLKTFDIDHTTGYNYKSHCEVEIPRTLWAESLMYSLFGVVDHSGGLSGGHYTATIQSLEDGHWYCFDDTSVRKLDRAPRSRSSTAYLLIYRDSRAPESHGRARGQQNMTQETRAPPAPDKEKTKPMTWQRKSENSQISVRSRQTQMGTSGRDKGQKVKRSKTNKKWPTHW